MKLCISTVVDECYQAWMPIFIYCCKIQYPEYDIKIFTNGVLDITHADASFVLANALMKNNIGGVDIINGYFKDWHHSTYSPIAWRFAIDKEEYKDYDYVYITDIDMMILREKVELLHFHLNEMAQTGLCYSNSIRNKKHWKGDQSLTGLHFARYEFFERTNEVMKKYAKKLKSGDVGLKREYDGNMLYRICKESGLGMVGKYPLVERHHGIHMGNFRIYGTHRGSKLRKRIDTDKCRKWLDMLSDNTFREIIRLCSYDPVVKEQTDALEEFCRKRVK